MQPGASCEGEEDGAGDDAGDGLSDGALGIPPAVEKATQFLDIFAGVFVVKTNVSQSFPGTSGRSPHDQHLKFKFGHDENLALRVKKRQAP
jgi:hypothetical protein